MAQRRVLHGAIDMGDRREWRVHQHYGGNQARVEMIMDMRGVMAGDGAVAKQPGQHLGARLGQFIEDQTRAPALGLNGE